ncbi:MAG: radical SAM protein [Acidobacteriota bacterium]
MLARRLAGGEPLAHRDFIELGVAARRLGFVVRIKSNGHALCGEMLRRIKTEIGPCQVEVSLHGARAETHDRQTRVPGSFSRLITNLSEMQSVGLCARLHSVLTRWNEEEVEEMSAIADGFGVQLRFDPEVTPRDDGDLLPLTIRPSREGMLRLYRIEFARGQAAANHGAGPQRRQVPAPRPDEASPAGPGKHCGAGSSGIAVDPYGSVYPRVQWRRSVGNLHRKSIREIWDGSPELQSIRRLTSEAAGIVSRYGSQGPLLAFCPGLATRISHDPLSVYPGAKQRAEILEHVQSESRPMPLPHVSGARDQLLRRRKYASQRPTS